MFHGSIGNLPLGFGLSRRVSARDPRSKPGDIRGAPHQAILELLRLTKMDTEVVYGLLGQSADDNIRRVAARPGGLNGESG
jgi:hypothetical protein